MSGAIKKIRQELGLNQAEFGRRIGRSMQSVQSYERGAHASPAVRKAIVELAESAGLGDLVDDFLSEREEAEIAPGLPIVGRPSVKTARLHDLLDEVLASDDDEAIRAVRTNLQAFARHVRGK